MRLRDLPKGYERDIHPIDDSMFYATKKIADISITISYEDPGYCVMASRDNDYNQNDTVCSGSYLKESYALEIIHCLEHFGRDWTKIRSQIENA